MCTIPGNTASFAQFHTQLLRVHKCVLSSTRCFVYILATFTIWLVMGPKGDVHIFSGNMHRDKDHKEFNWLLPTEGARRTMPLCITRSKWVYLECVMSIKYPTKKAFSSCTKIVGELPTNYYSVVAKITLSRTGCAKCQQKDVRLRLVEHTDWPWHLVLEQANHLRALLLNGKQMEPTKGDGKSGRVIVSTSILFIGTFFVRSVGKLNGARVHFGGKDDSWDDIH